MNVEEFANKLAMKASVSKAGTKRLLKAIGEVILENNEEGQSFPLTQFGAFKIGKKNCTIAGRKDFKVITFTRYAYFKRRLQED